jgi:ATP synthase in type III secretion protein N
MTKATPSPSPSPLSLVKALGQAPLVEQRGRIIGAIGTSIRVRGVRARIGEQCRLVDPVSGASLWAEVVGFSGEDALLTPLGELRGLSADSDVILRADDDGVPYGMELAGRVLDARLEPLDGLGPVPRNRTRPLQSGSPNPMMRKMVGNAMETGIRAIDGFLTLGIGQRVGIFAAAGCGKSTLMALLARQAHSDVAVIALIGERGREVREFVEDVLGPEGLARSIVIVATSDRPAMERVRAAQVATAIAEGLRDEGRHVLLMMDSVTRYARALREIGLSAGEPAVRRGFPPSVFAELPKLFERAGTNDTGAITGIYTTLLEEEDGDPIGEEVRSLLDGHITLSRRLAGQGHFPAIDILDSLSRLYPKLAGSEQQSSAQHVRAMLQKLNDIELVVQMGDYEAGRDRLADQAIEARDAMNEFLRQQSGDVTPMSHSVARLRALGSVDGW